MPSSEFAGWVIEYILIIMGVVTTFIMGDVFPKQTPFIGVVFVGIISVLAYVWGFRVKSYTLIITSLSVWVMVGAWSTFWGLAYGI